ncbi:hypothetical protein [Pseudomonas gingeri]|uniref:hypothetical protein n=1 Tax=Pseudomonas gingeri TaxID=117681 RepID=UPI00210E3732|nr:hypothetical protein [Pseudomonas gingeri]
MPVTGIGYLRDIERDDLFKEAERLFELAILAGAKGVQALTGPINVQAVIDFQATGKSAHYSGLLGLDQAEQYARTASNLAELAEWTSAVKATGYVGWWCCELFCKKQQQQNSYAVAQQLKTLLTGLVGR